MLRPSLLALFLAAAVGAARAEGSPAYTVEPLRARQAPAPGAKPFEELRPEDTGITVKNQYSDPRMWGDRFRELTLGAVETGVAVADFRHDGHLELFVVSRNGPCALYRQTAPFKFVDVAAAAGVDCTRNGPGSVTSATVVDINQDGWPDLYVCRFDAPNLLFVNNGDGTFTDVVDERLPHVTYFSMGADSGDLNNDGLIDFMVTDMRAPSHAGFMTGLEEMGRGLWEMESVPELIPQYMWNAVYLNTGTDRYQEIAHLAGVDATGWTWSVRMADLDNSGREDIFFTAGMIRDFTSPDLVDKQNLAPNPTARGLVWKNSPPRRERTLAFRNQGDLRFEDVSAAWGLDHLGVSFGCALADLDGRGVLDIVYNNYDGPPTVIRNNTTSGHRVMFKLAGRPPNRDAIGAELRIETASGIQVRQIYTERGVVASEPATVHFGLGPDAAIAKLTIHWPNGQVQVLEHLPVDALITVTQPPLAAGQTVHRPPARTSRPPSPGALFVENAKDRGVSVTAVAPSSDEFSRQRLLPRRLGLVAPAVAAADVDGDGITDLFVSGTGGQPGTLYLGRPDGTFGAAADQPWAAATETDDAAALFFDAFGSGHPDLLLACGGARHDDGDPALAFRLYRNEGHGRFTLAPASTLPGPGAAAVAAAAADFDGSGRLGVFIGGRSVPGHWPAPPRSFLYRNTASGFVDVTDEWAPGLRNIGMVTAAVWADLGHSGRPDLLLATEWGPIVYFHNTGHSLEDWTARAGLSARTGWWSALAVADLTGSGQLDIIAGNVGLNTKYHASAAEPTVLLAGDLDGSGREQLIEAQYEGGMLYPVRGRSKLAYVYPWIPRKFPTYEAYSRATIEQIFPADRLAQVVRYQATELASGIYFHRPDGTFAFRPLPSAAQIAPINAIVACDLTGHGSTDLYVVGNNFGPEPSTGRFDGGVSLLLQGDGHGGFTPVPTWKSGLLVAGDARSAAVIEGGAGKGKPSVAVSQAGGPLLIFSPNPKADAATPSLVLR